MRVGLHCVGRFAVKKIAIGQSASYLLKILREVHLLETLRHPNIITYHHAWLETAQFSSFGPRIPTLQYAPFTRTMSIRTNMTLQCPDAVGRRRVS
jgi:hypothetical protein